MDERKKSLFKAKLEEIKKEIVTSAQEIRLTPMEETVQDFVLEIRMPVTAQEVSEKMGDKYPSLKHRTHASATLNSLVSKGILGKFKVGYSYYFISPKEAVMEIMKRRGEESNKCSPAVAVVAFTTLISTGVAAPSLSNSGSDAWKHQLDISIKENSGTTLTDYQVLIEFKGTLPGEAQNNGADIRFRIISNQVGDFNVNGRIIYYFDNEKDKGEDCTLNLPIKVKGVDPTQTHAPPVPPNSTEKPIPGFGLVLGISGLLFLIILKRKW